MRILVVTSRGTLQEEIGRRLKADGPSYLDLVEASSLFEARSLLATHMHRDLRTIVLDTSTPTEVDGTYSSATDTSFAFVLDVRGSGRQILAISTNLRHLYDARGRGCHTCSIDQGVETISALALSLARA